MSTNLAALIVRSACESDPAAPGPDTISITAQDLLAIMKLHAAAAEGFESGCGCIFCDIHADHRGQPCTKTGVTEVAQIEALQELCACAYQLAGAVDAPVAWLDALSAASMSRPFSCDGLLPLYEPSQDAEDAVRYRFLRRGQRWSVINGIGDGLRADELDAAIDAAISASQGGGGGE